MKAVRPVPAPALKPAQPAAAPVTLHAATAAARETCPARPVVESVAVHAALAAAAEPWVYAESAQEPAARPSVALSAAVMGQESRPANRVTIAIPVGTAEEPAPAEHAEIAAATGGRYFHASNEAKLGQIYDEIGMMETTEVEREVYVDYREMFHLFLFLGLIILLLEILLANTLFRVLP